MNNACSHALNVCVDIVTLCESIFEYYTVHTWYDNVIAYTFVCVPTVYGGHSVPSACGDVCSPVCWRSKSVRWPLRLLQMCPPLYQWCGYYSGYCREWEAGVRKLKRKWEWKWREETWSENKSRTKTARAKWGVGQVKQYREKNTWLFSLLHG